MFFFVVYRKTYSERINMAKLNISDLKKHYPDLATMLVEMGRLKDTYRKLSVDLEKYQRRGFHFCRVKEKRGGFCNGE